MTITRGKDWEVKWKEGEGGKRSKKIMKIGKRRTEDRTKVKDKTKTKTKGKIRGKREKKSKNEKKLKYGKEQ